MDKLKVITLGNFEKTSFGSRLKTKLEFQGMSQKDLADRTGLTEVSISRYIHGTRVPDIEILCKIANALNCGLDVLVWEPFSHKPKHYLIDGKCCYCGREVKNE